MKNIILKEYLRVDKKATELIDAYEKKEKVFIENKYYIVDGYEEYVDIVARVRLATFRLVEIEGII